MIIKIATGRGGGKNTGSFGALAKYLTKEPEKNERVLFEYAVNTNYSDIPGATMEILNTQQKKTRVDKNLNYHLIVSFAASDKINEKQMREIELRVTKSVGFENHQRIVVGHKDQDNIHFHIAINRVNPETLKVHNPYNDMLKLQEVAAQIEIDYGLERLNHVRTKTKSQGKAADMESHRGQESMMTYVKNIADELKQVKNWQELHLKLAENGLKLEQKGQGFVIGEIKENDAIFVKASSVDRELSKKNIEAKLGAYQERQEVEINTKQQYEAKPIETQEIVERVEKMASASKNHNSMALKEYSEKHFDREYSEVLFDKSIKKALFDEASFVSKERMAAIKAEWKSARDTLNKEKAPQTEVIKAKYKEHLDKAFNELKAAKKKVYESWKPGFDTKTAYKKLDEIYKSKKAAYAEMRKAELEKCYDGKKESWKSYLHRHAESGSKEHLSMLRSLEKHEKLKQDILKGHNARELGWSWDAVSKGGVVKYKTKHGVVKDEGKSVTIDKINMQSVAFIVDVAIYKFALKEGSTIKIGKDSSRKFNKLAVAYIKANNLQEKVAGFAELEKKYGKESIVSAYKDHIIKKISHKLGVEPDRFRPVIPKSIHTEQLQEAKDRKFERTVNTQEKAHIAKKSQDKGIGR